MSDWTNEGNGSKWAVLLAFLAALAMMAAGMGCDAADAQTRRGIVHLKPQYSEKLPYGTVFVYCEVSTGNRVYLSPDDLFVLKEGCW